MNEREIRIHLYGSLGQEAADEAEYVSRNDPAFGRLWFSSVEQARMVIACAALGAAPRTGDLMR